MLNTVERSLNSIGKTNFVEYFLDYKELALSKEQITYDDKIPLAKKLLENKPNAKAISGQMIKITYAIKLFKEGLENDALREVINSKHPIITEDIKEKARALLTN